MCDSIVNLSINITILSASALTFNDRIIRFIVFLLFFDMHCESQINYKFVCFMLTDPYPQIIRTMIKELLSIFCIKLSFTFVRVSIIDKQLAQKLPWIDKAIKCQLAEMAFPNCTLTH